LTKVLPMKYSGSDGQKKHEHYQIISTKEPHPGRHSLCRFYLGAG
jgi:hypothetical protein